MSIFGAILRAVAACIVLGGIALPAQAVWVAVDPSTAQITKTLATTYDAEGNPIKVLITQQAKRADGVVETMTTLNENTYYASDLNAWRIGLVNSVKATHTQGSSVLVTQSQLVYDGATGAVAQEIAEPSNPDFRVVTSYARDVWGNVTRKALRANFSADPAKKVAESAMTTTYDPNLHLFPVSESNARGHSVSRTYDYANGYLLSETDPNGLVSRYQYDILGRVVASLLPDGSKTLTTYASCAGDSSCPARGAFAVKTAVVKDPDNALPAGGAVDTAGTQMAPQSYSYFDALRRPLHTRVQALDGRWIINGTREMNAKGQVTRSADPYFLGETALQWTSYTYDIYGRVVKTTQPKGTLTTVAYQGLKTTYTNELGQKRVEETGIQSKPVRVTEAFGTSNEASTTYLHDALGRMLRITDAAGKVRSYSYDLAGNKLTDNDPNQGSWSYKYDSLGRLVSQTDAKGQLTRITYDILGRVIKREATDFNSQWIYDTAVNGKGRLAQATASNGYSRTHSYDALGRSIQTTTKVDNLSYSLSTGYDALGRVRSVTYPTGYTYLNEYNALGFLTRVKSQDGSRTYWQLSDSIGSNSSDAAGRILKATLGNGIVVNRSFDPKTGQLTALWAGNNAGKNNVQSETYLFNDAGNLQSRTATLSNLSEVFQYDSLNRLSSATVVGQAAQTVQYDKVGNITFKSDIGHYRYAANRPQAVAAVCRSAFAADGSCASPYASYNYDNNGNVVAGGGRTYVWSAFNKPLSMTRAGKSESFAYDADYERIKHVGTDGAVTLYINPRLDSGAHFEVKRKGAAIEYTHHVYAGGEAVAAVVTLNTGAEVQKYAQDFATGTAGLLMPTAAADPLGLFAWDAAGQRLIVKTRRHSAEVLPRMWGSTRLPVSEGVKFKGDIHLGANPANGWRYLAVALNNSGSAAEASTGERGIRVVFSGDKAYVNRMLRETDGSEKLASSTLLGNVANDTTYTLEIQAHDTGVSIHLYPKGASRNSGYRHQTQVPQMDSVRFLVVGRAGPNQTDSISAIDNLSWSSGGITIGKEAPLERYLHKDHLGSIVAVTDNQGVVLERFSYDAWGKRRKLNGQSDPAFELSGTGTLLAQSTHHGFTGHEMLDEMSLVHMNGRIYDPVIGRFISADPHIDRLYSTQGLNSYSYVLNNPLNATDPTGYWSLKKAFKKLGSRLNNLRKKIEKEVNRPVYQVIRAADSLAQPLAAVGSYFCGPAAAACYAAASYHVARANGADTMQGFRVAAINGASAAVANGIGDVAKGMSGASTIATKVSLHALRGGITSSALGGDFRSGFVGGAFGAFGDALGLTKGPVGSAIGGGFGAKLLGGNFAEGAMQALIGHVFNDMMHPQESAPQRRDGPFIDYGPEISLRTKSLMALEQLLGLDVANVAIYENSALAKSYGVYATTSKNAIYLNGTIDAFMRRPFTVLEEYYHVIRQWNTGGMTKLGYVWELITSGYDNNKYEVEAWSWADKNKEEYVRLRGFR
ncbi:YD repeat (two copies) [compost metagenome]